MLVANAALADLLSYVMPSTISRLPGDVLFFIINYYAQRDFVFKSAQKEAEKKLSKEPKGQGQVTLKANLRPQANKETKRIKAALILRTDK